MCVYIHGAVHTHHRDLGAKKGLGNCTEKYVRQLEPIALAGTSKIQHSGGFMVVLPIVPNRKRRKKELEKTCDNGQPF